jgi:hypothetical protein
MAVSRFLFLAGSLFIRRAARLEQRANNFLKLIFLMFFTRLLSIVIAGFTGNFDVFKKTWKK